MINKGNHPQMAARFRLVKYYNLPRYIHPLGMCYSSLWTPMAHLVRDLLPLKIVVFPSCVKSN